jgi:polyketide biosynthesis enoyl-CoA hydratase PksH
VGVLNAKSGYQSLQVDCQDDTCTIRFYRPEARNTISDVLVREVVEVLAACEAGVKVVIFEGLPDVFCFGADFKEIDATLSVESQPRAGSPLRDPGALYDVWLKLAHGPFISVAHVEGKANAGGIGFIAACDITLAAEKAEFSLSELLFGLMPAAVLPFLIKRVGVAKANYMTLTTQSISAAIAQRWGLIDAYDADSRNLLRKHLLRLRHLDKASVARYKRYVQSLDDVLMRSKATALEANRSVFSDAGNLENIRQFVRTGRLPWERGASR